MHKYRVARELCDEMTRRFPEQRPNCEKILADRNSWAINDNEFDALTELRRVPDFNFIEHSIVYTFITAGLRHYKFSSLCSIS
jgi:hypothetical protein